MELHQGVAEEGVTSLNGLTGDVNLVAGTNITIVPTGQNLTISVVGGGSASLTNTYVGFGDASNNLTGSANFTWNDTTSTLTLGGVNPVLIHTADSNSAVDLNIIAGSALSGDNNGANLYFQAGYGSGAGTNGYIEFQAAGGDIFFDDNEFTLESSGSNYGFTGFGGIGLLDFTGLSGNQTYTFPDNTGTIALTSDITNYWTLSGSDIHNSNAGNVGINTASPGAKLHVTGDFEVDGAGSSSLYFNDGSMIFTPQVNAGSSALIINMSGATTTGNPISISTDSNVANHAAIYVAHSGSTGIGLDVPTAKRGARLFGTLADLQLVSGKVSSTVADSGTAKAYLFNTTNALTTTAKILSLQNNSVEKFYVSQSGDTFLSVGNTEGVKITSTNNVVVQLLTTEGSAASRNWMISNNFTNVGYFEIMRSSALGGNPIVPFLTLYGTDGASSIGMTVNTPAFTTTAKLLSLQNNTSEKYAVRQDGALVVGSWDTLDPVSGVYRTALNISGNTNTFFGYSGFTNLTSGINNTGFGYNSGNALTTGSGNTFLGYQAGPQIYNGDNNTALGFQALFSQNASGVSNNSAFGSFAGWSTVNGYDNVYFGLQAGYWNIDGTRNTYVGRNSGLYNLGSGNIVFGYGSGLVSSGTTNYSLAIGFEAFNTASNQAVIGGNTGNYYSDFYFGGGVTWASASTASVIFNATGGEGTNIAGASFTFAGGKATGNAHGGNLIWQTSDIGASGTTLQTLTTKMTLDYLGNLGVGMLDTNYKLAVNGNVYAAGILVEGGGSYLTNVTTSGVLNLGHASDTTIARVSAGVVSVEGNKVQLFGSGVYASRPAANSVPAGYQYLATDIGISPGCYFESDNTNWKQVGICVLSVNTSNITADVNNTTKSIFNTAPTLPNGSLAVGTAFRWHMRLNIDDAGSNDAAAKYQMLIGSTDVGNLTYAAFGEYNYTKGIMNGEMVVRTLGASGSVMGTMDYERWTTALNGIDSLSSATPTTTDTTGTISPDVKIVLSSFTNDSPRVVIEARIEVTGLV